MKTISVELFEFDELNEKAKEKVLECRRHINVEDNEFWSYGIINDEKDNLATFGYMDADIEFSGFHSQGDGARFGADVDLAKFLARHKGKYPLIEKLGADDVVATITRNDSRYFHENTIGGNVSINESTEALDKESVQLEGDLTEEARTLSRAIYRKLQDEYEFHTSDNAIADTLRANEYLFTADGEMWTK